MLSNFHVLANTKNRVERVEYLLTLAKVNKYIFLLIRCSEKNKNKL